MSKTPSTILRHAAATLCESGHCKGAYVNEAGEHCALGAVSLAAFGNAHQGLALSMDDNVDGYLDALDALRTQALKAHSSATSSARFVISEWNDREATTGYDVVDAMLQAVTTLELAEGGA